MTVFRNDGRWDTSNVIFDGRMVTLYDKHGATRPAADFAFIDYGLSALSRQVIAEEIPAGAKRGSRRRCFTGSACAASWRDWRSAQRFYEIGRRRAWRTSNGGCDAILIVLDRDGVAERALRQPGRAAPRQPAAHGAGGRLPVGPRRAARADARRGSAWRSRATSPRPRRARPRAPSCRRCTRPCPRGDRRRRRHPELAHLLPPRRGRLHLPEAGDGAARGGVRAEPGLRPGDVVDGRRPGARRDRRRGVRRADGAGRRRRAARSASSCVARDLTPTFEGRDLRDLAAHLGVSGRR